MPVVNAYTNLVVNRQIGQNRCQFTNFWGGIPVPGKCFIISFFFSGTRCMVDSWLVAHALPPGITTTLHNLEEETETELLDNADLCQLTAQKIQEEEQQQNSSAASALPAGTTLPNQTKAGPLSSSSKNSSGSGTPVRKISAHEFERGGLTKPLFNTVDGSPTFLSLPNSGEGNGQAIRKRSRHDIQGLNETDLILELVKDICNDLDIKRLCHKILQNVGILTNADR